MVIMIMKNNIVWFWNVNSNENNINSFFFKKFYFCLNFCFKSSWLFCSKVVWHWRAFFFLCFKYYNKNIFFIFFYIFLSVKPTILKGIHHKYNMHMYINNKSCFPLPFFFFFIWRKFYFFFFLFIFIYFFFF